MKVKIIGQDHYGRGITRVDGKITFVPYTLPGDIVSIEIVESKGKYNVARVLKYYETTIVSSPCPYYKECGGCNLLHMKYSDQLLFKQKKVEDVIRKFTKEDITINPIVYDKDFSYRNKIVLHKLGLYKDKTNDIVDIDYCMLVDPKINEYIKIFKAIDIIPQEVMIRTTNQNEIMIDIKDNIDKSKLANFMNADSIIVNDNPLTNKDFIIDDIDGMKFKVSSKSFYQVNRFLTDKLYQKVIDYVRKIKPKNAIDLYCGTGTITLLLSRVVQHITGIEVVSDTILDANYNKEINLVENAQFICGKVEDYIDQFKNIDLIVVDPPRSGLDSKTIREIIRIGADTLIYVSCDPVTLARDLNILKEKYDILEITPFDMFPNTYHVECCTLLSLKEN